MTRNFSVSPVYRDIGGWLMLALAAAGALGLMPSRETAPPAAFRSDCPQFAGVGREARCWITWRYEAVAAGEQLTSAATPICICSQTRGES